MENTNKPNYKSCAMLILLFLSVWGGCYYMMSGPDCIRTKPDGAVRCECDFKSSDEWQKFKEDTHGAWEAVAFEGDYDPCKKSRVETNTPVETIEEDNSTYSQNNNSTNQTTPQGSTASQYSNAEIADAIADIKKKFSAINYENLHVDNFTASEDFEEDFTTVYTDKSNNVVKIISEMRGASIISTTEYYYSNNNLYFIFEQQNGTNANPDGIERRVYVYKNDIIKIIENGSEVPCYEDCNFSLQSHPYRLMRTFYGLAK